MALADGMALEMLSLIDLQGAWDRTHREERASSRPEEGVVAFAAYLEQKLSPGALVLDVGCGRGRNTVYLSQLGFAVYGCDLSPVALSVAASRAQQADARTGFQVTDLTCLPYRRATFAAAVCVHVLPYNLKADVARGARELWRVLQPGGWLYLDLLDCDDAEYGCGPELEKDTFLDPGGMPIHFSSRQEVDELLYGFAPKRVARVEFSSGPRVRVSWIVWATG